MSDMLYKAPGRHRLHGFKVDYVVVEDGETRDGWHATPSDAHEAYLSEQVKALPTEAPKARGRKAKK